MAREGRSRSGARSAAPDQFAIQIRENAMSSTEKTFESATSDRSIPAWTYCKWAKPISHQIEAMVETRDLDSGCGLDENLLDPGFIVLGVPSPSFARILLSRKPPETQGTRPVFGKNDG